MTAKGEPASRRAILFLAHWVFFALGLGESVLAPSLPTLAEQMGVPLGSLGILFTARSFGFLAVFILANWLTGKLGRRRLMVAALVTVTAMLASLPLVGLLPLGMLLAALYGLGAGALSISANVMVGDMNPQERTVAVNRLYLFISIGAFIGPMLVGVALSLGGIVHPPFWLVAFMMLVALVLLLRTPLPPSPPTIHRLGSASLYRDKRLWMLAAFLFLFVGADVGFNGWIFSYVRTGLRGEVALASAASSAFWIAAMAGRLARLGPLRRLPDGPLMVGSCLSALLPVALLCLVRQPLLAVAATVWLGLSFSTLFPTALGLGQKLHSQEPLAAISLLQISSAIGSMVLPWVHGHFMGGGGYAWPFALLSNVLLVLGLAVAVSRSLRPEPVDPSRQRC